MENKKALHWKQLCGKDYLTADDLNGKEVAVTIKTADLEDVFDPKTKEKLKKGVITFNETEFKMVLNTTNAKAIKNLYGNKTDKWIGQKITLKPEKTRLGREMVDCIRVVDNSKPTFRNVDEV